MKLSTRGRYGVRLMLSLAFRNDDGSTFIKDIAKEEEISEKYLGHIVTSLKTHGLINSTRGAGGGIVLTRKPSEIKLSEIIQAVEGELVFSDCVNNPNICHRVKSCVSRDIWKEISEKINKELNSITLEDMVVRKKEKELCVSGLHFHSQKEQPAQEK